MKKFLFVAIALMAAMIAIGVATAMTRSAAGEIESTDEGTPA